MGEKDGARIDRTDTFTKEFGGEAVWIYDFYSFLKGA